VTHTRKPSRTEVSDPLDEVQNSTGLTAAADAVLVLKRPRLAHEGTLFITGRDIEERELKVAVDASHCLWTITEADPVDPDAGATPEQRKMLDAMRQAAKPISPADIARITGKDVNAVNQILKRMTDCGLIVKQGYGIYAILRQSASECQTDTLTDSDAQRAEEAWNAFDSSAKRCRGIC
jgi:hypothetical protein